MLLVENLKTTEKNMKISNIETWLEHCGGKSCRSNETIGENVWCKCKCGIRRIISIAITTTIITAQSVWNVVRKSLYQSGPAVPTQSGLQQLGQNRISVGDVQDSLPHGCIGQSTERKRKYKLKKCIQKKPASLGISQNTLQILSLSPWTWDVTLNNTQWLRHLLYTDAEARWLPSTAAGSLSKNNPGEMITREESPDLRDQHPKTCEENLKSLQAIVNVYREGLWSEEESDRPAA